MGLSLVISSHPFGWYKPCLNGLVTADAASSEQNKAQNMASQLGSPRKPASEMQMDTSEDMHHDGPLEFLWLVGVGRGKKK